MTLDTINNTSINSQNIELNENNNNLKNIKNIEQPSAEKNLNSNEAFKLDIKKSFQNPDNRIAHKIEDITKDITKAVNNDESILNGFNEFTNEYSMQKTDNPNKATSDMKKVLSEQGINYLSDEDKVVVVGATPEEILQREQDLSSKIVREKEILRAIQKEIISEITPNVENFLKEIDDKSKGIIEDLSKLSAKSDKLNIDFAEESKNFDPSNIKKLSGSFANVQATQLVGTNLL